MGAAHAAGVLTLEKGLRFAARRGARFHGSVAAGAVLVGWSPEETRQAVASARSEARGAALWLAADHGIEQVVAGSVEGIEAFVRRAEEAGVRVARLPAGHGFAAPSPSALAALADGFPEGSAGSPALPLVRGTTGRVVERAEVLDGAAWGSQAQHAPRFDAALSSLAGLGADIFVEIGPRAHLGPLIPRILGDRLPEAAVVLSSQGAAAPGHEPPADGGFLDAAAGLYEAGRDLEFAGLFAGERRRKVALPAYPFQRRRYWVEPAPPRRRPSRHALLGERRRSGRGEVTFDAEVSRTEPAWLRDHEVFGHPVAPPAFVAAQLISAALVESGGGSGAVIEDLEIGPPLVLPAGGDGARPAPRRAVQVVVGSAADGATGGATGAREIQVFSGGLTDDDWTLHATGRFTGQFVAAPESPGAGAPADAARRMPSLSPVDPSRLYDRFRDAGTDYGWSLRSVSALRAGDGGAVAEVSLPAAMSSEGVAVHPVLLDGCFQVTAAAAAGEDRPPPVVAGWDRLWIAGPLPGRVVCRVRLVDPPEDAKRAAPTKREANLSLRSLSGALLGEARGVRLQAPAGTAGTGAGAA